MFNYPRMPRFWQAVIHRQTRYMKIAPGVGYLKKDKTCE